MGQNVSWCFYSPMPNYGGKTKVRYWFFSSHCNTALYHHRYRGFAAVNGPR